MSTGPLASGFSEASLVYHFTDTIRLPWIIESGELQPGRNRIGDYPADFLWATTNDMGDRTSSILHPGVRQAYRAGFSHRVRISLSSDDFVPWREMIAAAPMWTTDHVARLEQAAIEAGERNIEAWCCRSTALPFTRAVNVHVKSFASGRWKQIDATSEYCLGTGNADGQRGFIVGDYAYVATRTQNAAGAASYGKVHRKGVTRNLETAWAVAL